MKKLNILNINLIGGRTGAARLCQTISESLDINQFEYHTLVGYDFGEDKKIISIYKTNDSFLYRQFGYKLPVGLNFLFDRMTPGHINMNYLQKLKCYREADIIHLHSIQGGYFDWKMLPLISKEKKIIMTLHDDRLLSGNDKNNNLFPYKTKRSYVKRKKYLSNSIIHYVGVSDRMTNKVEKDSILGNNTMKTIYNGIDTTVFYKKNKVDAREALGLPSDKKIILSIAGSGSKSNLKGLQYVEKIIKNHKNDNSLLFITIGNHSTKKISDKFWEIGRVDNKEMAKYFNASDMFLYPTLADNCPLSVLESISCGLPVLSFQIGGVPELVEHKKNGYIAPYKDYNELKKGFERILINKDKLNVALDPKFTQENMVREYIELYKSLMN